MFVRYFYALFIFCAHKFPVKSEQKRQFYLLLNLVYEHIHSSFIVLKRILISQIYTKDIEGQYPKQINL